LFEVLGSSLPAAPVLFQAAASLWAGIWVMPSDDGGLRAARECGLE